MRSSLFLDPAKTRVLSSSPRKVEDPQIHSPESILHDIPLPRARPGPASLLPIMGKDKKHHMLLGILFQAFPRGLARPGEGAILKRMPSTQGHVLCCNIVLVFTSRASSLLMPAVAAKIDHLPGLFSAYQIHPNRTSPW